MPQFQTSVNALFHADPREANMAFVVKVMKTDDTEVSIRYTRVDKTSSPPVLMYSIHNLNRRVN